MIQNHDRSGWFGASDTAKIMGSFGTQSFRIWWLEKLGVTTNTYTNLAMVAGSVFEHRILDAIGVEKRDRQIKIRRLRLRVNLDGETDIIHEVKTYGKEKFSVTKGYWMQCQVEMFATKKPCEIVAYRLKEEDYQNFFNLIDPERISRHPISYDMEWVKEKYLPRLKYLCWCLNRRKTPNESEFARICDRL